MKSRPPSFNHQPFEAMESLLRERVRLAAQPGPLPPSAGREEAGPESEENLFCEAMEGVTPLSRENVVEKTCRAGLPEGFREGEDAEVLASLRELVLEGKGFRIDATPEYIEGTGYRVHPEVARRLHRGEYAIQAFVDLHGLTAEAARETFEAFLRCAVLSGKRGVLVVHGRGLSSPSEPILKKKVVEWLTRGPWRKWIVAWASARACDGGAGATYVLLRERPVSKRLKLHKAGIGKEEARKAG